MKVNEAIKLLQDLPANAEFVVPDMGQGGCVPVVSFELIPPDPRTGAAPWVVVQGQQDFNEQ